MQDLMGIVHIKLQSCKVYTFHILLSFQKNHQQLVVNSHLEDARFIVYEDEREVIATNVSTCGLQRQSNKGKLSSLD